MSSSTPSGSSIAERARNSPHPEGHHARSGSAARRRRLTIRLAALFRWLHIYLSMFSLAIVLFFSVTGITLNHPNWFFGNSEASTQREGVVNLKWLHRSLPAVENGPAADPAAGIDKLEVVEHLRKAHGVRGALAEFRADDRECVVTFKGPGYSADAFIDRETGRYSLTESYHGVIAVINDLHKGRDTGPVWSVVIDLSAVLMTVVSLTGLVLLFYLKLRRKPGLVIILVGSVLVGAIILLWVP